MLIVLLVLPEIKLRLPDVFNLTSAVFNSGFMEWTFLMLLPLSSNLLNRTLLGILLLKAVLFLHLNENLNWICVGFSKYDSFGGWICIGLPKYNFGRLLPIICIAV